MYCNQNWEYDLGSTLANLKRWNGFLNIDQDPKREPFDWSHRRVMLGADLRSSELHNPYTVSGFSNWVFGIYRPKRNPYALAVGKSAESQITNIRLQLPKHDGWELLHDGTGEAKHSLPASSLSLNGQVLRGSPDLVFREKKTGKILILEIKATNARLPRDGWPNLRAQLWAYSKLNEWQDSPGMLLVGEVWNESGTRCRGTVGWDVSDAQLNQDNQELFNAYRKAVEHRMLRI